MEFFGNKLNGRYLRSVLPGPDQEVDWVKAAIAYGSDGTTLLQNCLDLGIRLDIWMRYDHTVPVEPALLQAMLDAMDGNVFCQLVPDVLHAKVIWWKGYGVYIGSANLTERAWVSNIEFGVFLSEAELEAGDGDELRHIEEFFEQMETLESTLPLSQEIIDEQKRIRSLRRSFDDQATKAALGARRTPIWEGPASAPDKKNAYDRKREAFVGEWTEGLSILRNIGAKVADYKPVWLESDVPVAWQVDQFLHAVYYNRVKDGPAHPYERYYQINRKDPSAALLYYLDWWSGLTAAPSFEDDNLHRRAPIIRRALSPENIDSVTPQELIAICGANHATADHVAKIPLSVLGLSQKSMPFNERLEAFGSWLYQQRNGRGESFIDLLRYVFDGGKSAPADLAGRVFQAAYDPERRFPHVGINQLSEVVGWARPELCSPRNGRTSKGLRALGYNVAVR